MSLQEKVAILTGACGDIGRETALTLARAGMSLVLIDLLTDDAASPFMEEVGRVGSKAIYSQADVTNREAVAKIVARAMEVFGRIDICIGNAATIEPTSFLEISGESWTRQLAVNLTGCFHISQAAARAMVQAATPGKIIFISSWVQDVPSANLTAYCVSKSGLKMLAKCMGLELGKHKITVNLVAPGFVDAGLSGKMFQRDPKLRKESTKIVPLGYIMSAAQVAAAVLFLCSPDADYMTGSTLLLDGGNSLFFRGER